MMTTMAEKLLAKAQELEQQAAALRVAAGVMNGHQVATKQGEWAAMERSAIKLRKQQRPKESAPPALVEVAAKGDIEPLVLSFLLGNAPQRVGVIRQHLADQGIHVSEYRVRHLLHTQPLITRQGTGSNTLWRLRGETAPPLDKPLSPHAALKAHRAAKVEQIVGILRSHGAPMKTRELAAAAREQGIRSLTGIVGLVRNGTLATRGKGAKRTYRLNA